MKPNNMEYKYKVFETYCKSVTINAKSESEAFEKIQNAYQSGDVKMDVADDFVEWEIYPEK